MWSNVLSRDNGKGVSPPAVERSTGDDKRERIPADKRRPPLARMRDVVDLAMFGTTFLIGLLPSERIARALCDGLAWCHAKARGLSPEQRRLFEQAVERAGLSLSAPEFQLRRVGETYREIFLLMKFLRRGRALPSVTLVGAEHVTEGLSLGRGVILWVGVFAASDFVTKMAFHRAGFAVRHLSMHFHGGSNSWLGRRAISRLRIAVENRYLAERLVLSPGDKLGPLRTLQRRLRENCVVSISAVSGEGGSLPMPLLGDAIPIGRAAPRLCQTTGAAILPVFTIQHETGGFEVVIAPPLKQVGKGKAGQSILVREYGDRHEPYVQRTPFAWRGWPEWRPDPR